MLHMRTGAPDFAAGEYVAGGNLYGNSLASDYESAARIGRRQEFSSHRTFERDSVCVYVR